MKCNLYIIVVAILLLGKSANGQADETIARMDKIISGIDNPRVKADTLNNFVADMMNINPDEAIKYCNQALTAAMQGDYTEGKKTAYYNYSLIYKNKSQFDSALKFTEKYLTLGKTTNDSTSLANGYLLMGNILKRKGDILDAQIYFIEANKVYAALNNKHGVIAVLNSLGSIFNNNSEYDSATRYYLDVLRLAEEIDFKNAIGSALINLGNVKFETNDNSLARLYYMKSIPVNTEINKPQKVALAYMNLGIILTREKKYDSSLVYFDKALEINKQIKSIIDINNIYINQSYVYKQRKEYSKALEKCNMAIDTFAIIDYPKGLSTALQSKADIVSELGMTEKATLLLDSSLVVAKSINHLSLQMSIYESYYYNYKNARLFEKAITYKIKYYELKDSIFSDAKQKYIANLSLKYEKEKDQARILSLTNDNLEKDLEINKRTNQRNIFLFTGAGIILITIFIIIFLRVKTKNDNYLALQKIRQLEKDKKLISVQFLMEGQEEERKRIAKELHDGIGVLLSTAKMQFTSIDGVSPSSLPKINNATKLLEMAASEVRKITHNMMPGLLSKYGFFEAVDDLVDQINDAGTIEARLNIDGEDKRFPENKEFMLYRIVQEMINNTIKHAQATKISINVELFENKLKLKYNDNGIGFNSAEKIKQKSIGLTSLNSRANYLGGNLIVDTAPGKGTKYQLIISIS